MPLYDYKCSACGQVHEHKQKITDDPLTECPECGGEYKRIITSVGIIFKGSGFHINDYRGNSGKRVDESKPSDADGKSGGDSGGKTGGDDSGGKGDAPASSDKGSDSKGDTKPASSSGTSDGTQGNRVA